MTVMDEIQSQPSSNGQDERGRFVKGHKLAKGNPHAKVVAKNRSYVLGLAKPEHLKGIFLALVEKALSGDVPAIKEALDRLCGKATEELDRDERSKVIQMFLHQVNNYQVSPTSTAKRIEHATVEHTDSAQADQTEHQDPSR